MLGNMDLFTGVDGESEPLFRQDTLIFPGHEYGEGNLKFNMQVMEPVPEDNPKKEIMKMYLEKFRENHHRDFPIPSVPSMVSDERKINLFMQCRDEEF
jgi:hypothetical protein